MTKEDRERAIKKLRNMIGEVSAYCGECKSMDEGVKEEIEAFDIAIQALEQPCEDAISSEPIKIDEWDIKGKTAELWIVKGKLQIRYQGTIHNTDLHSVQPKSPWIRIEFKGDALNCPLPDDGERVFLRFKNGYVTTDTCQTTVDEEDNTCYGFEDNPDFEDIDAWMKIPK